VKKDGQEGGGNRSRQDQIVPVHAQPPVDQITEAAGTDAGGQGDQTHGKDGGGADAGHDDGKGEGQFHFEQDLPGGHPHPPSGFDDGGIDPEDAGVGVAQNRKQCIQREGDDGGVLTDSHEGNHEGEERQARYRLDDGGYSDHPLGQLAETGQQDAEGNGDENG